MVCEHVRKTNNDNNGVYSRVIYVFIMKVCKVIVYTLIFLVTATSGESSSKGLSESSRIKFKALQNATSSLLLCPGTNTTQEHPPWMLEKLRP